MGSLLTQGGLRGATEIASTTAVTRINFWACLA